MKSKKYKNSLLKIIIIIIANTLLVPHIYANNDLYTYISKNIVEQAKRGNSEAQYALAVYLKDEGTERSYREARKWYNLSANQGHYRSKFNLGMMYFKGTGGAQDVERAISLFRSSALSGSRYAAAYLGELYYSGKAFPYLKKNAYKAMRASKIAAQRGDPSAQRFVWHIAARFPDLREYANPKVIATPGYGGI